jgi:DNA-binding response OmpR family regulator
MQILVIEDSDSIARMTEALVEGRGHSVRTVTSGAEGVDAAVEQVPDVVLLDWSLKGALSSTDVCARLRGQAATRETPIVVFGDADEDAKSRALDAGVHAYYTKPFSPLALLKELEALQSRSSGRIKVR